MIGMVKTRKYSGGGQVPGRPLGAGDLALLRMAAAEALEKKQDMSAFEAALERRAEQLKRKAEEERKRGEKQKPVNILEQLPSFARGGRVPAKPAAKPAAPRTAAPARPTSKAAPARPAARPASRPSSGGGRKGR